GIHSLAAAVVFVVLYAPLSGFYLFQTIRRRSFVFFLLQMFCSIRTVAFILRVLLIKSESAAHNLTLFIVYQVVFNFGFLGLIYSAYSVVLDRQKMTESLVSFGLLSRVTRSKFLFHISATAAVVLGIVGVIEATSSNSTPSSIALGTTLRKASVYIFLALSVLLITEASFLVHAELKDGRSTRRWDAPIGSRYGFYILFSVSVLLLMREAFFTGTANNTAEQYREALWYPLVGVTEFLSVAMFTAPGLVPTKKEI
ncbi:hypothetical protein PLICRDRAFT_85433, partial [Plicaturopsis crispa FD-325 SS-3]